MSIQIAKTIPTLTPEKLAGLDIALAKEIFSQGKEAVVFALMELSRATSPFKVIFADFSR